jgi:hypothetical protein
MPPKRKQKTSNVGSEAENSDLDSNMATGEFSSELQAFLDTRLKEQSKQINDLLTTYTKTSKSDLAEIKKSQDFLSSKFDELHDSLQKSDRETKALRQISDDLIKRVDFLESTVDELQSYLRRDLLEIHGVPLAAHENTDEIVLKVAEAIDPDHVLSENEISISHRLPARNNNIPPIIVKFTRRSVRDRLFTKKRNLGSITARDLGFNGDSRLYVNESLTRKSREILRNVKDFRSEFKFKHMWTKNGKIYLRESDASRVYSFTSLFDFIEFKDGFSDK